jgi:chromosomal replication initiation ATPase DnaA
MLFLRSVAEITGVSLSQTQSRCRNRNIASARRTAILAWRKLNPKTSEIAASLSISVSAATQIAGRNADRDFDAEGNAAKLTAVFDNQS